STHSGRIEALKLLRDVAAGAYELHPFSSHDMESAIQVLERYADLDLGLADASVVVLASHYACFDILTLDHRHFRAVVAPNGQPFRLLPHDAG
ncbi:MAG: VapC toxin family PIN domain ribonuclease, partial [Dehalococcoidia bacterium]